MKAFKRPRIRLNRKCLLRRSLKILDQPSRNSRRYKKNWKKNEQHQSSSYQHYDVGALTSLQSLIFSSQRVRDGREYGHPYEDVNDKRYQEHEDGVHAFIDITAQ